VSAKDIRRMVRKLKGQGWNVVIAKSGHWKLTSPTGQRMTCSMSPSDPHAYRNARADAKKRGGKV
jgi:predicted RNA binding protein YcfA (HicA-like mRNA interferase family)